MNQMIDPQSDKNDCHHYYYHHYSKGIRVIEKSLAADIVANSNKGNDGCALCECCCLVCIAVRCYRLDSN